MREIMVDWRACLARLVGPARLAALVRSVQLWQLQEPKRLARDAKTWAQTAALLDGGRSTHNVLLCALDTGPVIIVEPRSHCVFRQSAAAVVPRAALSMALAAACGLARCDALAWEAVWGSNTPVPAQPRLAVWRLNTAKI